ncbi:NAD(P)-dependent oxidoreductase [Macrococcus brunensis]|uniref:NAD(P)-dependent oxidoreductase n=1 Tax=Macrococcus brunensis TaxID=198483 RepID=A0A4R6BAR4_9STAP|nr:NmrA family NAD(P)-binding protein [Macrococcus brunensis]TDL93390.1 NAD(P)-dependent oxidoreductase [Macrococcus brunensis]
MKLLVTGATGHSGTFFLEKLNKNSKDIKLIRCLVRPTTDISILKGFKNLNIETVEGDIEDQKFLESVTRDIDTILNIANIRFTAKLQEAALKNNVDWLIAVHTTGRYSKFKSASKEYIEIEDKLLNERKMDLTILRPTMIYGSMKDHNMSKLIKFLDKSKFFPIFGNGKNLLQPVRAQDLAQAYYDVIMHPEVCKNKEYDLSGQDEITYNEIIRLISYELNRNTVKINMPINLSYCLANYGQKYIPKFPIKGEQVLRMQEDKVFSHEQARKDFGYAPLSFEKGIKNQVQEYLQKKRVPQK